MPRRKPAKRIKIPEQRISAEWTEWFYAQLARLDETSTALGKRLVTEQTRDGGQGNPHRIEAIATGVHKLKGGKSGIKHVSIGEAIVLAELFGVHPAEIIRRLGYSWPADASAVSRVRLFGELRTYGRILPLAGNKTVTSNAPTTQHTRAIVVKESTFLPERTLLYFEHELGADESAKDRWAIVATKITGPPEHAKGLLGAPVESAMLCMPIEFTNSGFVIVRTEVATVSKDTNENLVSLRSPRFVRPVTWVQFPAEPAEPAPTKA